MEVVDELATGVPAPPLRSFVAAYSGYRQAGVAPARHRGLPSPYVTVVVTLDEPLLLERPGGHGGVRRYAALAGGLHSTPVLVVHDGCQSGIQLALTPLGARALLGVPAGTLAGIDVHLEDVVGPSIRGLRDRLRGATSWPQRFDVLDGWLTARVDAGATWRPELAEAWRLLVGSPGALSVEGVARAVGWSPRHLRSQMATETGFTPKTAARVARFDRARRVLARRAATGAISLAELAATGGYADQAHLAREFRALAGCPPSGWLAEERRNVQAVEVDRGP